eukprot:CAMPEP_0197540012 /NCGR_PEP_ID=MMETSP1318-20131121/64450_1 /TAXON_ID=552666 /ORGANISM="Partenskyella glossopodia, Strain RCC365" /LENGTH=1126 /DNA_ID=CAMNT_0043098883 /DNA_START=142 /DNA_END=3519 /DNA_ORIENTATION=+
MTTSSNGRARSKYAFAKNKNTTNNNNNAPENKLTCVGCSGDCPKRCKNTRCAKCCEEFQGGTACSGHAKSRAKAREKARKKEQARGRSKGGANNDKRGEKLRREFDSPSASNGTTSSEQHHKQESSLPPGWTEHLTDNGIPYYYHQENGTSTWIKPVHSQQDQHRDDRKQQNRRRKNTQQHQDADTDTHTNKAQELPPGWTQHFTEKGTPYWDNKEQGCRSWTKPTAETAEAAASEAAAAAAAAPVYESADPNTFSRDDIPASTHGDYVYDREPIARENTQAEERKEKQAERKEGGREERSNDRWSRLKQYREKTTSARTVCENPKDPGKRIEGLRINDFLPETVRLVAENPIVGIVAPTGTGKTAGVPPCLALAFRTNIWVTVPTRSATKIWEWVSTKYRELSFGMAANSVRTYHRNTDVVYMTTGHMYLKLLGILRRMRAQRKKLIEEVGEAAAMAPDAIPKPNTLPGILMVDETHHPSTENYALLKLLKYMRKEFPVTVPKLVVSSATFGVEAFVADFPVAKMLKIPVQSYEVKIQYLPHPVSQKKELLGRAADAAYDIASSLRRRGDKGVVLVFCSGKAEVETVCEFAEGRCRGGISIMPLYSSLPADDIDEALSEVNGVRIVVATNLAESSITIPNTVAVVSTMFHKEIQLGMNERQLLKEVKISQASADQQKGRTGRTCPGRCFRMCTEREFKALPKFDSSEIHRSDAYRIVLDFVSSCFSPQEMADILEFPFSRIQTAINRLRSLGMIEETKDHKGGDKQDKHQAFQVTEMGEFVSAFPVIPEMGCVIYYAPDDPGLVRLLLICVAYAETAIGGSFFWFPRREFNETPKDYELKKRDIKNMYHERFRGASDLSSYVRIHEECEADVNAKLANSSGYMTRRKAYVDWTNENYMNNKQMASARTLLRNLIRSCEEMNIRVAHDLPERIPGGWWDDVHYLFTRSFSHCLLQLEGKKYYTLETESSKREGPVQVGKRDSLTTITGNPKRVISLHLIAYETSNGQRQIFAGGIFLPSEPDCEQLRDEVEHLLEVEKHRGLMLSYGLIETKPQRRGGGKSKKDGKNHKGSHSSDPRKALCLECRGDAPLGCPHTRCAKCCERFTGGRCRAHTKSKSKKKETENND